MVLAIIAADGKWSNKWIMTFFKIIATIYGQSGPTFFAFTGVAFALIFANMGAAYGTAKSAIGISNLGMVEPTKIYKAMVPIIMAGILGIYGLIVGVLMNNRAMNPTPEVGYKCFAAGIACGLSALASGLAIGAAGEAGVKAYAQTEDIFVGMILILIFAECIGLYGLIIAIIMISGWGWRKCIDI